MFDDYILSNKNSINYLVTPLTPYFICNHFISTEIRSSYNKWVGIDLELNANDLLTPFLM